MTRLAGVATVPSLLQALALVRPRTGWIAWLVDTHFAALAVATLPVCVLLGLLVGKHMAMPADRHGWIALLLLMPLAEELVFRGLLQTALLRLLTAGLTGPVSMANLLTSLCFVVAHLPAQTPAWAFAVGAPSLALGHLRERHGSVLPCIGLHVLYNAGFGATAWFLRP